MNFEVHEDDIKKLLLLPDRRMSKGKTVKTVPQYHKGVYLISRDVDDLCYKMGMAHGSGGLFPRLKQYKPCFPYKTEYYDDAEKLEKMYLRYQSIHTTREKPVSTRQSLSRVSYLSK